MPINRIYIYAYKRASSGARALQTAFKQRGVRCIRRGQSLAEPALPSDLVLTWGAGQTPAWGCNHHINTPNSVSVAGDKLQTFLRLKAANVPIPEFTTDIEEAKTWLPKSWVVCRRLLRASGGKGITLAKTTQEIVDAPLYVKYKRKQQEYRFHVFKGTIIDIQEKRKRTTDVDPGLVNDYIRNHDRGWVFCRNDVAPPNGMADVAINAVAALHLDFGAVDIIYNNKTGKTYVLEINTAPGIENTTLEKYVNAILL